MWIDTHAHLDAPEMAQLNWHPALMDDGISAINNVACTLIPAVSVSNFEAVRSLAHSHERYVYALGIHPLHVAPASEDDLLSLDQMLARHCDDPRLVAVGEIGLDYFVPEMACEPMRSKQEHFYCKQLMLARKYGLPVIMHVRKSADLLIKGLRDLDFGPGHSLTGIAHAFNGSDQQAQQLIGLGFCLGFGGAVTFERALQLRHLAASLPMASIVMETDSPDMPPQWLYTRADQRAHGVPQGINTPMQLPRIGAALARLRNMTPEQLAQASSANARRVLPKLDAWMKARCLA